jgi:hypothetical protein
MDDSNLILPELPQEQWPAWSETLRSQITFDGIGRYVSELPPLVLKGGEHRLPDKLVKSLLKSLEITGPFAQKGKRSTKNRTVFAHQREKIKAAVLSCREAIEEESSRGFGRALIELWRSNRFDSDLRWCAWGAGVFGDDVTALEIFELMREFQRKDGKFWYYSSIDLLEVLKSLDSDMARMTLSYYASQGRSKMQRETRAFIDNQVQALEISDEEYEDRIVPACGLDARGTRALDFGGRVFEVAVGENFYPTLRSEDGKLYKSMPRQRSEDDPRAYARAKDRWEYLRKGLVHVFRVQSQRLEALMVSGRRWSVEEWERYVHHHPLMLLFARNLLWGIYDDAGDLECCFRVAMDNTLADIEDDLFDLPEHARIGLPHPLEMTTERRQRWGDVFLDYELIAPFEQLGRPTFTPSNEEVTPADRFAGLEGSPRQARTHLKYHGYSREASYGVATWHSRTLPHRRIRVCIELSPGLDIGSYEGDGPQRIRAIDFKALDGKVLDLDMVDPVAFSEGLLDAQNIVSGVIEEAPE